MRTRTHNPEHAFTLLGAIVCLIVGLVLLVGLYMVVEKILSVIHRIVPAQAPDPPAQVETNCTPEQVVMLTDALWFLIEANQAAPRPVQSWHLSRSDNLGTWVPAMNLTATEDQARSMCLKMLRIELEAGSTNACGFWKYQP